MNTNSSRREFLLVTGSTLAISGLSGCLFGFGTERSAGTLVIRNDHSEEHTVTVTVTKTSGDQDDTRSQDETPSPETSPKWKREEQFDVDPDETIEHEEFIAETGAFYLEVQLENEKSDSAWVGFYKSAGGGIAEDAIAVDIEEDGRLLLYTSHGD